MAEAQALLRPGGFLVMASVADPDDGTDAVTDAVEAATDAGLAYFQHVVTLLAEVGGGADLRQVAHADVLVFRSPS